MPKTTSGQIFTIVYAVFGIPLMFTILSNLGSGVAFGIHFLWHLVLRLYEKIWNSAGYSRPAVHIASPTSICSSLTEPGSNEVKLYRIPLLFPIAITVGWMMMCSALFLTWERDWTFFGELKFQMKLFNSHLSVFFPGSFYFFFVSLTTVGLGDMGKCANRGCSNLVISSRIRFPSLICSSGPLRLHDIVFTTDHHWSLTRFYVYHDCERQDRPSLYPKSERHGDEIQKYSLRNWSITHRSTRSG